MSMKTRLIVLAALLAALWTAGCTTRQQTAETAPTPSSGKLSVSGDVKTGVIFRN